MSRGVSGLRRTVLYNGRIATPGGFVRGMATDGQRIALLGSSEEVLALHADERIDLEGRLVLPGFIDGHMHLLSCALSLERAALGGCRSIAELRSRLAAFVDETRPEPGEWVVGRGWNHELFADGRLPDREDLDDLLPGNPTLLARACGHVAVLNTRALTVLGLSADTRFAGGVVDGSETVDFWDLLEYWRRASERARPTNPPGQDEMDYPMGYDPPSEDDELEQLQPGQEPIEMPFIGDLSAERALAADMGGRLVQGGRTLVNAVLGIAQKGPSDVAGAADQGCLIIDGHDGVLQLDGPVVVDRDVVFMNKVQVSGQGTIYAGRNIHILGDIEYVNAPEWPKPDPNPEQTAEANRSADLMGLVAKGNIVFDAFWKSNPWESDVLEMLESRLDDSSPPFACHPTDATLGYCPSDGPYQFDGNYAAEDGLQKVASITSRRERIDGRQVTVKTATSTPSKFYESLVYEGMLSASTITRIDAVLYSNHGVLGKIGNVDINGSFIARDDIMTPLNWTDFNWDIRLGSQSLDGLDFPILLPMVVADPKVVGWKEVLL